MTNPSFVYVTYIATTPENLWRALTEGEITEKYFFGSKIESKWQEGSEVTYSRNGAVCDYGTILIYEPEHMLSFTWTHVNNKAIRDEPTIVTFKLVQMDSIVKLTLKHENLIRSDMVEQEDTFEGFNNGWPAILSNLKSLLEIGHTLPPISIS
ncbi:SRPBCC family protein [Cytobacillus massiliigabonensis]|uniref:SRPBCC family protein n=1 Tax=Cytobacillus massiliigabonensis TaxID=1871011 RepID=UPI000C821EEE|nr:SRPBCC family protein [Cytobacillus massiliigabonensis]